MSAAPDAPLLAIESATAALSVALRFPDGRTVERAAPTGGHHAEAILPLVEELLAGEDLGVGDPGAIAVSIGPGSFTSLRVGLATAKGLAFATERRLVPVPTLEALARGAVLGSSEAAGAAAIAATLDARRGDLYAAVFDVADGVCLPRIADGLFAPDALRAVLPEGCTVVGEGAAPFADAVGSALPAKARVLDAVELRWPRAAVVAAIAAERLAAGDLPDADDLAPRYVRRAEAEAKRVAQAVEDPS